MGFNQHTRGVWCNNLVYNLHLLTGKISEPGNSPFSLTGQPSACGTAREVGTFSHRLPADMLVANKDHRGKTEAIWQVPQGTINPKPGFHAVLQNRMLRDGLLNAYWVQVNNNLQAAPNMNEETYPGYRNPENFIVVSEVYPTVTAQAADLVLPTAMWVEKEGAYGNAERRTQLWHQLVNPPGKARSDLWQLMEFAKRFKIEEVRAHCPDCHVPHTWTNKIARKMQASNEVWGKIFGEIDTREKFQDRRLGMAAREWARMKTNDSLECRNCHGADSMDITRQSPRAAAAHQRFLFTGQKTCIDCHKGIAHQLPEMRSVPGWQ